MVRFIGKKLGRAILTVLTIALALPLTIFIVASAAHQANDMISEMTRFSNDLFHSVYGGIEYPMSVGDSEAVREQLLQMSSGLQDVQIYITDLNQHATYSTDADMIGRKIDNSIYNQTVWKELISQPKSNEVIKRSFEEEIEGKRYLSMVRLVKNKEKCHQCHGSDQEVLGSMVVRMGTDQIYANIYSHVRNNFFVGVLSIGVIISFTYLMLFLMVTKPVKELAKELEELPDKIDEGELETRKIIKRENEIGCLEKTYYKMRKELFDKNDIITNTNEELSAANKELEAFAYSVSHDLRAPLRNIDGFSKIILEEYGDKLEGTGEHYLTRVRNGATKMSQLIDDMLSFSRAGRTELRLEKVSMNRLINNALRDFTEVIKEKDIDVKVDDLPEVVCDQKMIQHVFANFISNAIKYSSEEERPQILIGFDEELNAFYIKDNGIGFEMQYHDKIFQVFQRLQLPEDYEGTGIGLAIVKRLVERHYGKIWAESELGSGSTFYVQLPLEGKGEQITT
jgi:signal transduction histidine kinase